MKKKNLLKNKNNKKINFFNNKNYNNNNKRLIQKNYKKYGILMKKILIKQKINLFIDYWKK